MPDQPEAGDARSPQVGDPVAVAQVFDQLPMLIVATEGPDHRIVAATGAYRRYTGRQQLVGAPLREVFAEALGQQVLAPFDEVYASGLPLHLREFRAQLDLPDTGGQVEFFADVNAYPRWGPDGEVVGVTLDMVDVTEWVRERQAAQRREVRAQRRYEQARGVIDVLQRELLPAGLPVLPRVEIAASYLLADADTAAGGDWFDAVALPDGRVALVVGDVVGHGVAASAAMGQLRVLLHERLEASADIVAALVALDSAAHRIRGARAATVCVVALDPVTGAVRYCTAGHPAPLVVSTNGPARYLPITGAGPLGVGGEFTADSVGVDQLTAGELVLLYTDGILERPGRELAASTVELAQAVGDIAADRALRGDTESPVERVCTQTLELLTRVTGRDDDITLLAATPATPPPRLALRLAAVPESMGELRDRLEAWLTGARVSDPDADALRHAVVELATNAIEHAYLDSADRHNITLTADLTDRGEIELQIADQGRWRPPAPSADRGLGLPIAENLVDTLRITHDEHGTTAAVTHCLSRPARLLTADDAPWTPTPPRPARADGLLVLDQSSASRPRVRIEGPVDLATATAFDRAIRTAGATGTRSLTLDLTGITHLASAGVAALHQLRALHRGNHTDLRLYAPVGTPADMILSLVQLDHHTHDPGTTRKAN